MSRRGTLTLRREDGRIVCEKVDVCDTAFRRMRGLLGRGSLTPGEGITLRPAWSIHTAFMRFPIDVVFIDSDLVVLRIDPELRSFRTAACRGAREVVELSAGECARRGLAVGDRIAWASHAMTAPAAGTATAAAPRDDVEPRARIVLASRDARFVKLARFLLDGKGIEAVSIPTEKLAQGLDDADADAVILDAQDAVADALAAANDVRSARPEVPVLIVGETRASERSPAGVRIYDKWNESEELLGAVEEILAERRIDPEAPIPFGGEEL